MIIAIIALMIPIVAILSGVWLNAEKLKAEHPQLNPIDEQTILKLNKAVEQNDELRERVKNLEYIITSMDESILALHAVDRDDSKEKVAQLAEKIKEK